MQLADLIDLRLISEHKEGAEEAVELLLKSTQQADAIRQFMAALEKRKTADPDEFLRSLKLLRVSGAKMKRYLSAAQETCQALLAHVDQMAEEAKIE